MECAAEGMQKPGIVFDCPDALDSLAPQRKRQHTVIGSDEEVVSSLHSDRLTLAPDAWINDRHVNRPFSEVSVTSRQRKCSGAYVSSRHSMRQINNPRARSDTGDDSFHRPHKPICES